MRWVLASLAIFCAGCGSAADDLADAHHTAVRDAAWATSSEQTNRYTGLIPLEPTLSATDIMKRAHAAAGGSAWTRPQSLSMDGYAVFYTDGQAVKNEHHRMWRGYDRGKTDAHAVDGKVRIESIRSGKPLINLSFDGAQSYTPGGALPQSESDARWSSNFGFGVIRHALDAGYSLRRLPDDLVDGQPAFVVNVIDPAGGATLFAIRHSDAAIVKVGFKTPRGWHERIYSDFYTNPGIDWVQPGRVRLYYDGVKANEVIWTSFTINDALPDCLFRLPEAPDCRNPTD